MKRVLMVALAAAGVCSPLVSWSVGRSWKGGSGYVTDPAHWDGAVPGSGDAANINQAATYTVTFTNTYANPAQFVPDAKAGHVLTLAGTNAVFAQPTLTAEEGTYNKEPLQFCVGGRKFLSHENWWSVSQQLGPFSMSDFSIRLLCSSDSDSREIHFDRGTYNFYDPEGTALAYRNGLFTGTALTCEGKIVVHEGANMRFAGMAWIGCGRHNTLRFEGGSHSFNGVINFNYNNGNNTIATNVLELADGAVLTMNPTPDGGVGVGFSGDALALRRTEFDLSGTGTKLVAAGTGWSDTQGGVSRYRVTDGATFESASSSIVRFGGAAATHHDAAFLVSNATLRTTSGTTVFGGSTGQTVRFAAIDATLDIGAILQFEPKAEATFENTTITGIGPISVAGSAIPLPLPQNTKVRVRDSGVIGITNKTFTQSVALQTGDGLIDVRGGRWNTTAGFYEKWNGKDYGGSVFHVAMTDSEIDWRSSHFLDNATVALTNVTGFVTNLVIGTSSDDSSAENVVTIHGGAITNQGTFIVGQNRPGALRVTGGRHVFLGGDETDPELKGDNRPILRYACSGTFGFYSAATFEISGAETEVDIQVDGGYFANDKNSSCNLKIDGGTLKFGKSSDKPFYFASQNTSVLTLRQTGGTFAGRGNIWCSRGTIDWLQTGGAVSAASLSLAASQNGLATAPQTYELAGGTATFGGVTVCHNTSTLTPCTLKLTGGTLAANYVVGGGGAACRGGKGSATLIADGGTLVARQNQATFLQDFDTADIRSGGLVIDTDYAVTVAQDFTNLTGSATSCIFKRGKGTLTLTGSTDPTIAIVVEEGVVSFGTPTTIASLTLGTATSGGGISLGSGVTLAVAGTVNVIHDGSPQDFSYATDPSTGATIVTVDDSPAKTIVISLDEGTSNATANITYRSVDTLQADVASGANLTLSGAYARGAFEKAGAGVATLVSEASTFNVGLRLLSGTLGAASMDAFGMAFAGTKTLTQSGGTLNLPTGTVPFDYEADTGSSTEAFVIKNDADVTVSRTFANKNGALFKRGAGKLRFETPVTFTTGNGVNALTTTTVHTFDEDGTPPTTGYAGFNIVEGEVELADASYTLNHSAFLGLRTVVAPTATPTLTITNATVSMNGNSYNIFCVGPCVQDDDPGQEFRLNILESTVTGGTVPSVGGISAATAASASERVDVLVRDSTLNPSYAVYFNENKYSTTYWTVDNSKILVGNAGGSRVLGAMEVEFTNGSVYSMPNDGLAYFPAMRNGGAGVGNSGFFRFSGGSKAYISRIGGEGGYMFGSLRFDGGYWYAGECPRLAYADGWLDNNRVKVILEEGGVTMPVATVCRNTIRLQGAGGLVKTGAGELVFDTRSTWEDWGSKKTAPTEWKVTEAKGGPATWSFTGVADIREGTLSVTNTALAADVTPTVKIASGATWKLLGDITVTGATVSGAGTVTGGTLSGTTVKGVWTDGGTPGDAPTFAGTLAGRVTFDFGRAKGNPLPRPYPTDLPVATVTGDASGATWRATGLGGGGLQATFRRVGTKVYCDVAPGGLAIILR